MVRSPGLEPKWVQVHPLKCRESGLNRRQMEISPAQPPFSFFAEELAHVLGKAGHDCAYTKTHGLLWAIQKSGLHARYWITE